MYCSTCGASVPPGRHHCETCGTRVASATHDVRLSGGAPPQAAIAAPELAIGMCPRCDYEGQGLPYFTKGPHMAALLGLTLMTLPIALGAGGFLYYALRRDFRVCPRCGQGWGRRGERGIERRSRSESAEQRHPFVASGNAGVKRAWSVMLLSLGVLLLTVGAVQLEAVVFVLGILSTAGGVVLHREAKQAREERRAALIASMQMPVLRLAAQRGGKLTVTDVAASLSWPMRRAERVLHSLDDGWRVSSDITDDGVIVYEFRELLLGPDRSSD